jgi:hypothetical protein
MGSWPFARADWIKLVMAALRCPARSLPAKSQLLSIGTSPSGTQCVNATQRLATYCASVDWAMTTPARPNVAS